MKSILPTNPLSVFAIVLIVAYGAFEAISGSSPWAAAGLMAVLLAVVVGANALAARARPTPRARAQRGHGR